MSVDPFTLEICRNRLDSIVQEMATALIKTSTLLLSKNYHLFSVDLRGMGKSGRITPQQSRFDWVTDINCLINKIFKSPGYLVGHSLGGWICAGVASINHKNVRATVLGDPFTGIDTIKSSNRKKIKMQEITKKKSARSDVV